MASKLITATIATAEASSTPRSHTVEKASKDQDPRINAAYDRIKAAFERATRP